MQGLSASRGGSPGPAVPRHLPLPSCRGRRAPGCGLREERCSVVQRHQRGPVPWVSRGGRLIRYVHALNSVQCIPVKGCSRPPVLVLQGLSSVQTISMI